MVSGLGGGTRFTPGEQRLCACVCSSWAQSRCPFLIPGLSSSALLGAFFSHHLSKEIWALHLTMFSSPWTLTPLEKTRGEKKEVTESSTENQKVHGDRTQTPGHQGKGAKEGQLTGTGSPLGTCQEHLGSRTTCWSCNFLNVRNAAGRLIGKRVHFMLREFYACF